MKSGRSPGLPPGARVMAVVLGAGGVLHIVRPRDPAVHPAIKAALWARLPAQLPMIRAVLAARPAAAPTRPGPD
jgi:hypothetical protein